MSFVIFVICHYFSFVTRIKNQKPKTKNQKPKTKNQKPMTNDESHMTMHREPVPNYSLRRAIVGSTRAARRAGK